VIPRRAHPRAGAAPHVPGGPALGRGQVDEIDGRGDVTIVRALVWVEAESQKGILIGSGGRMIKAIGTAARKELERELAARVHLELSVRVRRGWRGDESLLDRLGIE
jgi:GTP-binding protein Era